MSKASSTYCWVFTSVKAVLASVRSVPTVPVRCSRRKSLAGLVLFEPAQHDPWRSGADALTGHAKQVVEAGLVESRRSVDAAGVQRQDAGTHGVAVLVDQPGTVAVG
ncbi:Uncharacterised protein [Mycobacteroides abscessus subsp. abscessus]|nr:Uncharacterised protein [Mycobacteroides abscessus subsp. abscessus]